MDTIRTFMVGTESPNILDFYELEQKVVPLVRSRTKGIILLILIFYGCLNLLYQAAAVVGCSVQCPELRSLNEVQLN